MGIYSIKCKKCNKSFEYRLPSFFHVDIILPLWVYFSHVLWAHPKDALKSLPAMMLDFILAVGQLILNAVIAILWCVWYPLDRWVF